MHAFFHRKRIKHFVASKADLIFKLNGKEKLRSGIDYNIGGCPEGIEHVYCMLVSIKLAVAVRRSFDIYRFFPDIGLSISHFLR